MLCKNTFILQTLPCRTATLFPRGITPLRRPGPDSTANDDAPLAATVCCSFCLSTHRDGDGQSGPNEAVLLQFIDI